MLKDIQIARRPVELEQRYILIFKSAKFVCSFDAREFYKSFYNDEIFYKRVGKEFCIALDVALNIGGSEAIVEGFYSVMKTQQQDGNQSNETLYQRTIVDWLFPPPINCPVSIREVAKIYLDGNSEYRLDRHMLPMFF